MGVVRSRRAAAAVAAVVSTFALVACSGGGAGDRPTAVPTPAVNATDAALLPTDVAALPAFDARRFDMLLGQLRGTPVLVNIWGSWCEPCRDEAPGLASAHERFGRDVQFLGVDILDARGSARDFIAEYGWRYPSVFDPPGAIRDALGLLGQPVTLLYDRDGDVIDRWVGPVPPDELDAALERVTG